MTLQSITVVQHDAQQFIYRMGGHKHISNYVTFDFPVGDGTPLISIENDEYCYIISERGTEYERRTTTDYSMLLYWIASNISFSIATDYELKQALSHNVFDTIIPLEHF